MRVSVKPKPVLRRASRARAPLSVTQGGLDARVSGGSHDWSRRPLSVVLTDLGFSSAFKTCCWDLCHSVRRDLSRGGGGGIGCPSCLLTVSPFLLIRSALGSHTPRCPLQTSCWSRPRARVNTAVTLPGPPTQAGAGDLQVAGVWPPLRLQPEGLGISKATLQALDKTGTWPALQSLAGQGLPGLHLVTWSLSP